MEIARGAEAILRKENSTLIKERIRKGYRLEKLDTALRRKRTRNEATLIREARRAGVNVPKITEEDEYAIKMEFIQGDRVKDILAEDNYKEICEKIGEAVVKMHSNDIVHGDLTTSNMLLRGGEIYFIDFGLGFRSMRAEDKANDLFLLHEALESTHFALLDKAWNIILKVYAKNYGEAAAVFDALQKIEKRRRYTKKD